MTTKTAKVEWILMLKNFRVDSTVHLQLICMIILIISQWELVNTKFYVYTFFTSKCFAQTRIEHYSHCYPLLDYFEGNHRAAPAIAFCSRLTKLI